MKTFWKTENKEECLYPDQKILSNKKYFNKIIKLCPTYFLFNLGIPALSKNVYTYIIFGKDYYTLIQDNLEISVSKEEVLSIFKLLKERNYLLDNSTKIEKEHIIIFENMRRLEFSRKKIKLVSFF